MSDKRRTKEEAAILALAYGASVTKAAEQSGIPRRTLHRRLTDPEFRRQIQTARGEAVQRSAGMLTAAGPEAAKTLMDLLKAAEPAAVRLGASRAIFEHGVKLREMTDLEERLTTLEQQLATSTNPKSEAT